jgi:hypothetical protein
MPRRNGSAAISTTELELFHAVNDGGASAAARVLVVARKLPVRFRNVFYPEVQADFVARGGQRTPALWDGVTLHQGAEEVMAALTHLGG